MTFLEAIMDDDIHGCKYCFGDSTCKNETFDFALQGVSVSALLQSSLTFFRYIAFLLDAFQGAHIAMLPCLLNKKRQERHWRTHSHAIFFHLTHKIAKNLGQVEKF